MTKVQPSGNLRMIPVDRIEVLNPRDRNKQVFEQIVENIKTVGLKKPITAHPATARGGGVNDFSKRLGILSNVTSPVKTTCFFQSGGVVFAQSAFHVLHTDSPGYGRHPE